VWRHVTSCRYVRLCSGPDTTGKWHIILHAYSCNLSGIIHQNQSRAFSFIPSVQLKELRENSYFIICSYGVKYQPSLNKETKYWKIWAVKNETHCFVLPQFMSCCAGAVLKRRLFHIWGLEEIAREGLLLYFESETDISYISSLIVLHYNTRRVFYVWTSGERREKVLRKWQGRFWRFYTFQYMQHSITREIKIVWLLRQVCKQWKDCDYIYTSSNWNVTVETKVLYYSVWYIALNYYLGK
jgi:hypothetical protein